MSAAPPRRTSSTPAGRNLRRKTGSLEVAGLPTGASAWRKAVAAAAVTFSADVGLALDFALPPGRWVDLDTLVETTVRGLGDAAVVRPRLAGIDAIVATKRFGQPGVVIREDRDAGTVLPPGAADLDVTSTDVPRAGAPDTKVAWREVIAEAWGPRPVLTGRVWTEVVVGSTSRSLLGPLEVALDALEPVLGRDPRGREWQAFFPNDHLIEWLRIRRHPGGAPLRLLLGALD